mmetsp:Transcript_23092/g.71641  ORF Transcript_23092/g.71641 Transcript_23092/m.71641 type:complete len:286 (-) Transcript_23092:132-989(-)
MLAWRMMRGRSWRWSARPPTPHTSATSPTAACSQPFRRCSRRPRSTPTSRYACSATWSPATSGCYADTPRRSFAPSRRPRLRRGRLSTSACGWPTPSTQIQPPSRTSPPREPCRLSRTTWAARMNSTQGRSASCISCSSSLRHTPTTRRAPRATTRATRTPRKTPSPSRPFSALRRATRLRWCIMTATSCPRYTPRLTPRRARTRRRRAGTASPSSACPRRLPAAPPATAPQHAHRPPPRIRAPPPRRPRRLGPRRRTMGGRRTSSRSCRRNCSRTKTSCASKRR